MQRMEFFFFASTLTFFDEGVSAAAAGGFGFVLGPPRFVSASGVTSWLMGWLRAVGGPGSDRFHSAVASDELV